MGKQPFTAAELARAQTNGLKRVDLPSIGSGLARIGANEFFGISDRGPNGEADGRRTFPLPKFCPFITRFKLIHGTIEIQDTILIKDGQDRPLSGLSNGEGEERLFESADANTPLPLDANGVDPEAIRVFPDGKFLISEEYGPSLLVLSTNGQVLIRYTPQTKTLPGAAYAVKAILPSVLAQRRTNRGFEALALSLDGKTAYVMLQSPLGKESDPEVQSTRVSRVLRLDMSDPLNARVSGHYLMPLSRASDYSTSQKQSGLKLNDAEWIAPDKLLVLEQGADAAHLLIADFSAASNLLNHPDAASLKFEAAGDDLSKLTVTPARVDLWARIESLQPPVAKLEGLAILSPTEIAVANDNDFGLGENKAGDASSVWILRLQRPLPH